MGFETFTDAELEAGAVAAAKWPRFRAGEYALQPDGDPCEERYYRKRHGQTVGNPLPLMGVHRKLPKAFLRSPETAISLVSNKPVERVYTEITRAYLEATGRDWYGDLGHHPDMVAAAFRAELARRHHE